MISMYHHFVHHAVSIYYEHGFVYTIGAVASTELADGYVTALNAIASTELPVLGDFTSIDDISFTDGTNMSCTNGAGLIMEMDTDGSGGFENIEINAKELIP